MIARALIASIILSAWCYTGHCATEATAASWNNYQALAEAAYKDGNWLKARQLYELCVRESDELGSADKILPSLEGLAAAYCQLDQLKDAQPVYQRALALAKAQRGEKTSAVVSLMLDLASCYESQGNHRKAEPLYTRVLHLNEQVNGNTADGARTFHRVALHYARRNNLAESRNAFQKAINVYNASLGAANAETTACLRDFNDVNRKMDRPGARQAATITKPPTSVEETTSEQALLRAPITAPSNSSWATTLSGVAEVAAEKQQNESEMVVGRAPAEQAGPMFGTMVAVRGAQKRYDEAEPLYKKVIDIDEQSLGPDHPGLAADLNNLALLYLAQKKFADAAPLLQRSINIYAKSYGPDNLAVVTSRINLATCFVNQGQYQEADKEYRTALDGSRKLRSGGQYQSAKILNALGYMYFQQGRLNEANTAYGQAVDACEQAYGAHSKLFAACLDDYAKVMRAQNKATDAEQLESRAAKIFTLTATGN